MAWFSGGGSNTLVTETGTVATFLTRPVVDGDVSCRVPRASQKQKEEKSNTPPSKSYAGDAAHRSTLPPSFKKTRTKPLPPSTVSNSSVIDARKFQSTYTDQQPAWIAERPKL